MAGFEPIVWTELHLGQGLGEDVRGLATRRTWRVSATPEVALTQAEENNAFYGAVHPRVGNSLRVNNVSFTVDGGGTVVVAQYVPVEYLDPLPNEDTTNDEYIEIDSTFENVDVDIPVFEQVTKSFGEGEAIVEKTVWQRVQNTAGFRYTRTVNRITLNALILSGDTVNNQLNIVRELNTQTNKIHTIDGFRYLFEADGVRRLSKNKYQFTYRWTHDPGVPDTLVYDSSFGPRLGGIGSYAFPHEDLTGPHAGFIIGPYRRLDTAPDATDPEAQPVITFSPAYEEMPLGHLSLPGAGG